MKRILIFLSIASFAVWMIYGSIRDSRAKSWVRDWEKKEGQGLAVEDSRKAQFFAKEAGDYTAFEQRIREHLDNKANIRATNAAMENRKPLTVEGVGPAIPRSGPALPQAGPGAAKATLGEFERPGQKPGSAAEGKDDPPATGK